MPISVGTFSNFVNSVNPTPSPIDNNFTCNGNGLLVLAAYKAVTTAPNNNTLVLTASVEFNSISVPEIEDISTNVRGNTPTCRAYFLKDPPQGAFVLRLNTATDNPSFPLECVALCAINIHSTSGFSGLSSGNRVFTPASSGQNNINPNLDEFGLFIGLNAAQGGDTDPFVAGTGFVQGPDYTLLTTGETGASTTSDIGFGVQYRIPGYIGNVVYSMSWASSDEWGSVFVELLSIKEVSLDQLAFLPISDTLLNDGVIELTVGSLAFLPLLDVSLSAVASGIPESEDEILLHGNVDEVTVYGHVDEIAVSGHVDEIQVKGKVNG